MAVAAADVGAPAVSSSALPPRSGAADAVATATVAPAVPAPSSGLPAVTAVPVVRVVSVPLPVALAALAPVQVVAAPTRAPAAVVAPIARPLPTPPRMSEDSILARIIAGIAVPAAELEVAPAQVSARAASPAVAAGSSPAMLVKATADAEALAATKAADLRKLRAAREAADEKKVATARKAVEEKAVAAKAAAEEKKAARAEPARVWVQVAGGARESDLPKAWAAVKGKSAQLASRDGYWTPLRSTNRVVTGPFKTEAEAQVLVNRLGKDGVSAFTFTSESGQKMTRLSAK